MDDWIAQLAGAMDRLDDNSHTGCAPNYERLIRAAVEDLAKRANEKLCSMCPDPCDSLKPWRCVRPGSPWYYEDGA